MTGTATQNGTADDAGLTPLAKGLKNDRPEDSRSCPHECHGSLSLLDDNRVICETCRCTPDGIYIPLDEPKTSVIEGRCLQSSWFNPYPSRSQNGSPERYDGSNRVRLPGGFEEVYDEDPEGRPRGVGDEYTWDLSTL